MVRLEGPAVLFRGLKPAFAFQIAVNGTRLGQSRKGQGALHACGRPEGTCAAASRRCPAPAAIGGPSILRCSPALSPPSLTGTFIPLKRWLVARREQHGLDDFWTSLAAGAGAGCVGAAIGTPFQLIKTRMQAAARGVAAAGVGAGGAAGAARLPYTGLGDALASIIRTEGAPTGWRCQCVLARAQERWPSLLSGLRRPHGTSQAFSFHALGPPRRRVWALPRRAHQHGQDRGGLGGSAGRVRRRQGAPAAPRAAAAGADFLGLRGRRGRVQGGRKGG